MSDISTWQLRARTQIQTRSMGVKLIIVCGLALAMTIPAISVGDLIDERTHRQADVVREISTRVGGPQTFLGPTLAIPYKFSAPKIGYYLIFPARAAAILKTTTEERRRSLFKVPVFQADLRFDASFDLAAAPDDAQLDWPRAQIVVGASDSRGALADALVTVDGKTSVLVPLDTSQDFSAGEDNTQHLKLALFGASLANSPKPNTQLTVTSSLRFSGAQRVAVLAYGKTTRLSARGDWPSPGFDGGFLPGSRTVSRSGFTAEWSIPFLARGVRAEGPSDSVRGLDATALGVSFIEVADPYQSVSRSLKYVLLFLGLLFLSYFVFEVSTGKRVHPAQYILVGIAQIIFYLLLLSLAERTGFDFGFLFAGASTVLLLSANAAWVFSSRLQGIRASVIFSSLYTAIFLLLRLEDNALLVGAIASFLALAAAMYFTRDIDWHGDRQPPPLPPTMPA